MVDIYSKHNLHLTNSKIKINIPITLREWLVDDYDAVMHQSKVNKIQFDILKNLTLAKHFFL